MLHPATHTDDRHSRPCLITALWKGAARPGYLTPAACKRRALDGVAGFGEAMKGDGVKRLRKEEITGRDKECEAEGGVYRRLRSVEYQCDSDGAGLAVYFASAVTERSCIDSIKPVLVINPRISEVFLVVRNFLVYP